MWNRNQNQNQNQRQVEHGDDQNQNQNQHQNQNQNQNQELKDEKLVVVSPYKAQCNLINKGIRHLGVACVTADSLQGDEREVMILSAVRSNRKGAVGFLSDYRRVNVLLTRARAASVIIGNADTLYSSMDPWFVWYDLLEHLKAKQCFNRSNDKLPSVGDTSSNRWDVTLRSAHMSGYTPTSSNEYQLRSAHTYTSSLSNRWSDDESTGKKHKLRRPECIHPDDNRADFKKVREDTSKNEKKGRRDRYFYCDSEECRRNNKTVYFQGNGLPIYWGGYVNKTWAGTGWTRETLYKKWENRTVDLTWYCVPCYRRLKNFKNDYEAALALNVWQNCKQRDEQVRKWKNRWQAIAW